MADSERLDPMLFLRAQYRESLIRKQELLRSIAERLSHDATDGEAISTARESAHTLKGSGATYGFPRLSEIAKQTEKAPESDFLEMLRRLTTTLAETIEQCPKLEDEAVSDSVRII